MFLEHELETMNGRQEVDVNCFMGRPLGTEINIPPLCLLETMITRNSQTVQNRGICV